MAEGIIPGLAGEHQFRVEVHLTAQAMGSGRLPVLATPALVALMEGAAVRALDGHLAEQETSVGNTIEVHHLAATGLGQVVRARAEVTHVEGRRITFKVEAWDEQQVIGAGSHTRVIVDVARFMQRVHSQSG
jgi:fluoroacetyl-CoA thioesterase